MMGEAERGVLAVNAGSSSLKLGAYALDGSELHLRARIQASGLGSGDVRWSATDDEGITDERTLDVGAAHSAALQASLTWLDGRFSGLGLVAAGHRVVHGGTRYVQPTLVTPQVLSDLRGYNELAPLHEPHNLRAIEALTEVAPTLPQVACFDTAFHGTVTGPAATFALPRDLTAGGVRRYGFHGLSYEYIASALPAYLGEGAEGRVVVAHLGHGASMCAMRERRSVATTMSMTPLDGLPMGTRCGSLDPGVILYLLESRGMAVEAVNHLLYHESGLLGLSGVSAFMDVLLGSDDPRAEEAIEYYVYWSARTVGSLAAALGGLDAIVFTAGVGEHSPEIRARILDRLGWLGVEVDVGANEAHGPRISSRGSRVSCWVVPTDEEIVVARAAARLLDLT